MTDTNTVLVWLHVELVISLKTFMLIHNKGVTADVENKRNTSTSHSGADNNPPLNTRVLFLIMHLLFVGSLCRFFLSLSQHYNQASSNIHKILK